MQVDYLKEDSCGGVMHGTTWQQYARMRDALNATNRTIHFSITEAVDFDDGPDRSKMHCPYLPFTIRPWLREGLDPATLANSYLIEYCNNFDWFGFTGAFDRTAPLVNKPGGFLSQLDSQALLTYDNMTMPGAMSDMDMLQCCNGGQSAAEYRSQFSTFSILTSPLILGNDVRQLTPECSAIILNPEIIAINQDDNVVRGRLVYQWPQVQWPSEQLAVSTTSGHPAMTGAVRLQQCDATAPAQQWCWASGQMLQAHDGRCLTYGGQVLTNLGLAQCADWNQGGIGGQSWALNQPSPPPGPPPAAPAGWVQFAAHCLSEVNCTSAHCDCASKPFIREFKQCDGGNAGCLKAGLAACVADPKCSGFAISSYESGSYETYTGLGKAAAVANSDWTAYVKDARADSVSRTQLWTHVTQTTAGAGHDKCLDLYDCRVSAGQPLQLCECAGGGGCGLNASKCPLSAGFELEFAANASNASGFIRSALEPSMCLTAGPPLPIPKGFMNITLQVWSKPLASGAVAAVALNRGVVNRTLNVTW